MQTDLITKVYFNEHLTHSCVGMPQGLQALSSSYQYILLQDDKKHTTQYCPSYMYLQKYWSYCENAIWSGKVRLIHASMAILKEVTAPKYERLKLREQIRELHRFWEWLNCQWSAFVLHMLLSWFSLWYHRHLRYHKQAYWYINILMCPKQERQVTFNHNANFSVLSSDLTNITYAVQ